MTEGVGTKQAQCLSTQTHPGTPYKAQAQGWAAPVHSFRLESRSPWARLLAWPSDNTREVVYAHVCVYYANVHVCTHVYFCLCALPCACVRLYVCTGGLMCAYLRILPVLCHDTSQE